jgi:hypothetical protein
MTSVLSKIIFYQNTTCTPPQPFSRVISPVLPLSEIVMRIFYLIKPMSLDVIFDTDSEYHMHFTQKPIFIGLGEKISAHF